MATILLDCDGVLADFTGHIHAVISRAYPDVMTPDRWTSWDFMRDHYTADQRALASARLREPDFWETILPIVGARAAVERLVQAGHAIHVVTSPWRSCREWATVRTEWIGRHFDLDHRHVHVSADKSLFTGRVFVDDKPEHVAEWRAAHTAEEMLGVHGLLFDQPYNRQVQLPRVPGWTGGAVDMILGLAA
jgi:5'(3')-deoxyribonucleotidase